MEDKKLDTLIIPLSSFFKSKRIDWHPKRTDCDKGGLPTIIELTLFDSIIINGPLVSKFATEFLYVRDIKVLGEGSDAFMRLILEPALKDSTGELIVSCIWEGGDEINQLVVKNGKVEWYDIALEDNANIENITILREEYERLIKAAQKLQALENAGVDNWEGYDTAIYAYEAE